jgi:pimeloyl-ACP methyl ester carboxylesterase
MGLAAGEGGPKRRLRDLVVLLPGITGSVLQQRGREVWAPSWRAAANALTTGLGSLHDLRLEEDDPDADELADGVRATRVVHDVHVVPGLVKVFDGYSAIPRLLEQRFAVEHGTVEDDRPANFFEFPYDWRRDNRVAARRLKAAVDRKLRRWREERARDARVILLAHSMGGLVARHYLEVLEGWRDCRALITFGTPFRGSLKALGFLSQGARGPLAGLVDVAGSFTALHQLLPIYRAVLAGGTWQRAAEVDGIPHLDRARADAALRFHREVELAVERNRRDPDYLTGGYRLIPIVGTRQPTPQSAELVAGRLRLRRELPPVVEEPLDDGDGTVPRVSAIPIDLSDDYRETFWPECHGSLQAHTGVLHDVLERIAQMQVTHLKEVRGPLPDEGRAEWPAVALEIDDLYLPGEPVEVRVTLPGADALGPPVASVERVSDVAGEPRRRSFEEDARGWLLRMEDLEPGVYRLHVRTSRTGPLGPPDVHDLFQVGAPGPRW